MFTRPKLMAPFHMLRIRQAPFAGGSSGGSLPEGLLVNRPLGAKKARRFIPPGRWWTGAESNRRHSDFQSDALPTELPVRTRDESHAKVRGGPVQRLAPVAEPTGLEPAISGVTGRCVDRLHHGSVAAHRLHFTTAEILVSTTLSRAA